MMSETYPKWNSRLSSRRLFFVVFMKTVEVDCSLVCEQYSQCMNSSEVQLGYTCDASICTTEKKDIFIPACMGLQDCDISELAKAEFAAGCSCCASQLCGCEPNNVTNEEIRRLNMAQLDNGDVPQCSINDTLCGTAPGKGEGEKK